jgi:hypothetical protein
MSAPNLFQKQFKERNMKKEIISKLVLAVIALAAMQVLVAGISAQNISTDPQNPTPLAGGTITGELVPEKNKKYYVTFLAGPGDIFFDVNISPKQNNGAVFFWTVYRSIEDAAKDNPWCPNNLYLETEKKGAKCVIGSGDNKTRQVVLGFGATPNGAPVKMTYAIKLSGQWKPISGASTSSVDLGFRQALYVDTFQEDKVDTKAKYATPATPLNVFRADNLNCDNTGCGFQVGFYVFRDNAAGGLTTSVTITNGKASKTETVSFEPGKKVAEAVVHLPIFNGNNKISVQVDPQNARSESNENNNRFEVTVVLKP